MTKIRLNSDEVNVLKYALAGLDPDAELYLYGSRVDSNKKGGDIDLLVISKRISADDLSAIRRAFYDKFGEQKIDLILDDGKLNTPFVRKIFPMAIKL